jgi:hypothetical protein
MRDAVLASGWMMAQIPVTIKRRRRRSYRPPWTPWWLMFYYRTISLCLVRQCARCLHACPVSLSLIGDARLEDSPFSMPWSSSWAAAVAVVLLCCCAAIAIHIVTRGKNSFQCVSHLAVGKKAGAYNSSQRDTEINGVSSTSTSRTHRVAHQCG